MCVPDFILVHVVSLATRNISLTVALQKKVRELEGIIGELKFNQEIQTNRINCWTGKQTNTLI